MRKTGAKLAFQGGVSKKPVHEVAPVLLDDREKTAQLGARARQWVVAERDWRELSARIADIYSDLTGTSPA